MQCDYVRPSCGMCVRSRISCSYDDELRFVPQYYNAGTSEGNASSREGKAVAAPPSRTRPAAAAAAAIIQVPVEAQQNVQMFFDKFLTYFLPATSSDQLRMEAGWVFRLPELRRNFKPLNTIVNAFALMLTARDNGDEGMRMDAMRLYGRALEELSAYYAEDPGVRKRWHEAALTSIFLQYYEVSCCYCYLLGCMS